MKGLQVGALEADVHETQLRAGGGFVQLNKLTVVNFDIGNARLSGIGEFKSLFESQAFVESARFFVVSYAECDMSDA